MRRIARHILIPLTIGLLTTMLFAWPVSLLWPEAPLPWPRRSCDFISECDYSVPGFDRPIPVLCVRKRRLFVEHAELSAFAMWGGGRPLPPPTWAAGVSPRDDIYRAATTAHGWPLRTMASETFNDPPRALHRHAWVITSLSDRPVIIPLRPIWTGLLVNTVLFALAYALIAWAVPSSRRRRGLCPHCRYDLRGTPPTSLCPECGRHR